MMFSLICARIKDGVNNREAGDLRRHRPHYDVTVMYEVSYERHSPSVVVYSVVTLNWLASRKHCYHLTVSHGMHSMYLTHIFFI